MRRIVALSSALALVGVLTGCFGEGSEPQDAGHSPAQSAPVESPAEPVETPEPAPEPDEPEPQGSEPSEPADESAALEPDDTSLDATFAAMLEALEADGEEGMLPFLESPDAGDVWHLSDWEWTGGPCLEGGPGESACVGYFEKDGMEMENVFGFESVDGQWLLVESWVAWE